MGSFRTMFSLSNNRVSLQLPVHRQCGVTVRAVAVQNEKTAPVAASSRKRLGDSDLLVSECCLGTMTWGKQNTESDAHDQLSYALDLGVNFMDTAEIYPVPPSEETQGQTDRYIATWLRSIKREDIILATKVAGYGNKYLRKDGITRVEPRQIAESVENSLARLGTEYIDLLQVHWPDRYVPLFGAGPYDIANEREDDIPFEEQLRGLEDVVKAGKVRYIGVSNETSYGVVQFVRLAEQLGLPKIVSIQNSYSLLVRSAFETDLVEVCAPRQCNVGLLAYSPLAGGSLSGKYVGGNPPSGSRLTMFPGEGTVKCILWGGVGLRTGYMERYNKSLAREAVSNYVQVAEKHGLTAAQLALAWCKSQKHVTSSIIGATTMEQLKENIGSFDINLSSECMDDIEKVYLRYRDPTTKPLD